MSNTETIQEEIKRIQKRLDTLPRKIAASQESIKRSQAALGKYNQEIQTRTRQLEHLQNYDPFPTEEFTEQEKSCCAAEQERRRRQKEKQANVIARGETPLTPRIGLDFIGFTLIDVFTEKYDSVESLLNVPDEELLAIPGLGPSKLNKLREGLKEFFRRHNA